MMFIDTSYENVAFYLKKLSFEENLGGWIGGRLGWLRYENEDANAELEEYIDDPYSDRQFQKLLRDIQLEDFDCIVVWSRDDLTNSEYITLLEISHAIGVKVKFFC